MRSAEELQPGELISPAFLEHLFGPPASVPPRERTVSGPEEELISDEMLRLLFPKAG